MSYAAHNWATLHPIEILCTLLSYAAPYWATLHPIWATLHPIWATLHPIWATLHPIWATLHPIWATLDPKSYAAPSELSCTLLSYVASYWATLDSNWSTMQPKNYNLPPPPAIAVSLFLPAKLILYYRGNPAEIPVLEKIRKCSTALLLSYLSYYVPRPLPRPSQLRWSFRWIIYRENPAKIPVWEKSSAKFTTAYIVQQSRWRYIFLWLGLNKEKSLHTLHLRSVSFLSLHL